MCFLILELLQGKYFVLRQTEYTPAVDVEIYFTTNWKWLLDPCLWYYYCLLWITLVSNPFVISIVATIGTILFLTGESVSLSVYFENKS